MTLRNEPVDIAVDGQIIYGTLFIPPKVVGGVLFAHGWGGNRQQYVTRASAIAELGYLCLTFDMRGHARDVDQRETVSRADSLRDLLAAYDLLAAQPGIDSSVMGIVGSSYGAYLAAITTSLRPFPWLALRAPALYKDDDWELPKVQLHQDPDFSSYRRHPEGPENNRALQACAAFRGEVLIVESEHDDTVPHQVIENYFAACMSARSVTRRLIKGADHSLSDPAWQRESTSYLVEWFKERRAGDRSS
jgi:dipeptidyl aminopeptidase/acylaminoacyl peptidase